MLRNQIILYVLASLNLSQILCIYEEYKSPSSYLEGRVGGFVVFNCNLEFPNEYPIPYHLQWRKDVSILVSKQMKCNFATSDDLYHGN